MRPDVRSLSHLLWRGGGVLILHFGILHLRDEAGFRRRGWPDSQNLEYCALAFSCGGVF